MNVQLVFTVFLIVILGAVSAAPEKVDWSNEDRDRETSQVAVWRGKLTESAGLKGFEKIKFLELGLRSMGHRKSMTGHVPEVDVLFSEIRDAITSVPGHGEYFSDKILKLKPTWREHSNKVVYDNTRMWTMQTLQHIPSPEVVRVLGEFLSDEEETQRPLTAGGAIDSFGPGSNASLAAEALKTLIAEPPVPKNQMTRKQGDIKAWQIWYENVKSGTLTFRFEGDATEYDLNGPAPKEKLRNIERDRKRDDERAAGHKKSTPSSGSEAPLAQVGKPLSIAGVVIALALVSGAIWYFLRGRKPA